MEDCRICGCGAERGPLVAPCRCKGSMQYAHRECMREWLWRAGGPSWSGETGRCPTCMSRYRFTDGPLLTLAFHVAVQLVRTACAVTAKILRWRRYLPLLQLLGCVLPVLAGCFFPTAVQTFGLDCVALVVCVYVHCWLCGEALWGMKAARAAAGAAASALQGDFENGDAFVGVTVVIAQRVLRFAADHLPQYFICHRADVRLFRSPERALAVYPDSSPAHISALVNAFCLWMAVGVWTVYLAAIWNKLLCKIVNRFRVNVRVLRMYHGELGGADSGGPKSACSSRCCTPPPSHLSPMEERAGIT